MKTSFIFLLSFASIVLGQSTSARAIGDSPNTAHAVNLPNVKFDSIAPEAGFSACTPEPCIKFEASQPRIRFSNTEIRWTVGGSDATIEKNGKITLPKGVTQRQALKALFCWMGLFYAADSANCGDLEIPAAPNPANEQPKANPATPEANKAK